MKLVLLGTAGYHPNEQRQTSCVLLPSAGIVFDAGTGFFRLPQHLETDSIDIFLSHAHLDHVAGLTFLLDIQYQRPLNEVCVHGEASKLEAIERHLFSNEIFPLPPAYVTRPIEQADGNHRQIGDARISWLPLSHPGGSLGFRVDFPQQSMAYITDTTAAADAEYLDFIRGVDLLIHECNFPDGFEQLARDSGHSCLTPVAELARAADVGGLVLMHFNPLLTNMDAGTMEQAQQIFSPIVFAEDNMEIDF